MNCPTCASAGRAGEARCPSCHAPLLLPEDPPVQALRIELDDRDLARRLPAPPARVELPIEDEPEPSWGTPSLSPALATPGSQRSEPGFAELTLARPELQPEPILLTAVAADEPRPEPILGDERPLPNAAPPELPAAPAPVLREPRLEASTAAPSAPPLPPWRRSAKVAAAADARRLRTETPPSGDGPRAAPARPRLAAWACDAALVLAWTGLAVVVASGGLPGRGALPATVGLGLLVAFTYRFVAQLLMEATPGQLLVGLRVARVDGGRAGPTRHAARAALGVVATAALGLGLLPVVLTRGGRGVHDLAAGTIVVRA